MVIKDKAYYESFNRHIEYSQHIVNYHTGKANYWKDIYLTTKGKRGYGWLNKLAKRMNEKHVEKGTNIAMKTLDSLLEEMKELDNYLSNKEELA